MSVEHGYTTLPELSTRFSEAQDHLIDGRLDQGYDMVNKVFIARGQIYNQTDVRLKHFINPLLKAYCQALLDEFATTKTPEQRTNLTEDLLEFCIASEQWEELEILLQERGSTFRETRASSSDDEFWHWYQSETGAQSQLAQLRAPGGSFYWEDSRTYLKSWESLKLVRAQAVDDPLQELPFSIVVHQDGIEYANAADETRLQGSEILSVLQRKQRSGDWDILAAWEQQLWQTAPCEFARSGGPHKIWIFPEDIVECKPAREDQYGFVHVCPERSEWMTARSYNARSDRPNEPVRAKRSDGDFPYAQRLSRSNRRQGYGLRLPVDDDDRVGQRDGQLSKAERKARLASSFQRSEAYRIREISDTAIEVTAPFVAWEDFERSVAYTSGFTYAEYLAMLADNLGYQMKFYDYKALLCKGLSDTQQRSERESLKLSDSVAQALEAGFLGYIPSGAVLSWRDESSPSVNIVSSLWHDWKIFELEDYPPEVTLPGGEVVHCLGSITGTWIFEEDVEVKWEDVQFLVVDVDIKDNTGSRVNFVMSRSLLSPERMYTLTSPELRFSAANICRLSLFRFARPEWVSFGSKWKKFAQVTTAAMSAEIDEDNRQWEESNRRDKWDRSYEKRMRACRRLPDSQTALAAMQTEYDEEAARRRMWDDKGELAGSMSSLALSNSSGGTLQGTKIASGSKSG